jgi:hypothetical protein
MREVHREKRREEKYIERRGDEMREVHREERR